MLIGSCTTSHWMHRMPLLLTRSTTYGPCHMGLLYLSVLRALINILSLTEYTYFRRRLVSLWLFLSIRNYFLFLICDQFAVKGMLNMASLPYTSWVGLALRVVWTTALIADCAAARIPEQGSCSSNSTSLPYSEHSNDVALRLMSSLDHSIGLGVTSGDRFSLLNRNHHGPFWQTSPMNSMPLSNISWVGHGYRVSHVCSTTFATRSAVLVLISLISNHDVAGSIIVTHHSVNFLWLFLIV